LRVGYAGEGVGSNGDGVDGRGRYRSKANCWRSATAALIISPHPFAKAERTLVEGDLQHIWQWLGNCSFGDGETPWFFRASGLHFLKRVHPECIPCIVMHIAHRNFNTRHDHAVCLRPPRERDSKDCQMIGQEDRYRIEASNTPGAGITV